MNDSERTREQLLEELARVRARLETLENGNQCCFETLMLEGLEDAVYAKDLDGRYVTINTAGARLVGKTPAHFVGKMDSDVFSVDSAREVTRDDRRVLESGETISHEETLIVDGVSRTFLTSKSPLVGKNGKIGGLVGLSREITARKQDEESIRELQIAVENAMPGISRLDPDGRYSAVREGYSMVCGYDPEELVGKTWQVTVHRDSLDEARRAYDHMLKENRAEAELVGVKKDGTTFHKQILLVKVMDRNEFAGHYCFMRDITERKLAEERLRKAQKLEAIGTLAGGIAHDFNNLLFSIEAFTDLTLRSPGDDGAVRSNLTKVLSAVQRAKGLVTQILTFTRNTEQKRQPLKLSQVIDDALKILRPAIPSNIEIFRDFETEFDVILADPTQLHQMLVNLCTNAAHAMKSRDGKLTLSLGREQIDEERAESLPDLSPGPHVRLRVSDTGVGIEADVIGKIFDPFFTTKDVGEGTGLGLSVVDGIVKSLGGIITAKSEPGLGTTFTVYLPQAEAPVSEEKAISRGIPGGHEKILFVDDEALLVQMGQQLLETLGYDVVALSNSTEALRVFRSEPSKFDLVITDQTMPRMTGDALSRELLNIRPCIPIILCSGYTDKVSEDDCKRIGIRRFLKKPTPLPEYARIVREVLDGDPVQTANQ